MRKIFSVLLSAIMVFALIGCNPQQEGSKDEPMTLKIGAYWDLKYGGQEPLSLITDFLTGIDKNYNATPALINDWDINEDATEYTLHIQKNVTFHDGSVFDAKVCKYDLEKLGAKFYATYAYMLKSIEIVDDNTLTVKFDAPHLFFMEELFKIPALPVDSLDNEGNITDYIGTGLYKLDSYEENVEATFIKNENYWNTEKNSDVDIVEYYVIADGDARMTALESGQVDVVGYSEMGRMIPASSVGQFETKNGYKVIREDKTAYAGVYSVTSNYLSAPMDDVNLRRAIAFAIDRDALVETVFFGEAFPAPYMMNPAFIGGSEKVEPFTVNIEKAKQILSDGDYVLENDVLTKDGKSIELDFITLAGTEFMDFGVFIQSELAKLGIKVNLESLDYSRYAEKMMNLEYDIAFNNSWFAPTVSILSYLGTEATDMSNGGGLGFAVTEEIQKLANEMMLATNKEDFQNIADKFWIAMYDACPSAPTYAASRAAVHSDKWTGFAYDRNIFKIDLSKVTKINEQSK
ncbi:MAG: ABC transporter substrate-binding protein [Velocimicrobium sp.]